MLGAVQDGRQSSQEIAQAAAEKLMVIGSSSRRNAVPQAEEIICDYPGGIVAFIHREGQQTGLHTGFTELDLMTNGLQPGDLFLVAGRPSMGKTAWAMNVARNVAVKQHKTVVVFSLEMSRQSLLSRMVCSAAMMDSQRFKRGDLRGNEADKLRNALSAICESSLYIDDTPALTVFDLLAKCRQINQSEPEPLSLVVVDYLQLMAAATRENRNQEVSAISRGLKLAAKELRCPIMALSQLTRSLESRSDKRPMLSDLRQSGSLEQNADLVGFVFREEVYSPEREELKGLAELILAKQRNGPVGTVNLVWLAPFTRFENRAIGGNEGAPFA
jgi:replicative DNA helicase